MRYISEYRRKALIGELSYLIKEIMPKRQIRFMEVCGTHTHNFLRFGLDKLMPLNLKLVSGPGCPVCVSTQEYIDKAVSYARLKDTVVLTFADMLRVAGSNSSLERERGQGLDVRVVYSAWESIRLAKENRRKNIIFLAVGFETTAPTIALTLMAARKERIENLFFFPSLRLIPAAMECLVSERRLNIQGFLCPGHVSAIIGTKPYEFIPRRYKIPCCVAGFEPLDMLQGIYFLLKQFNRRSASVKNQYRRAVKSEGNPKAKRIMFEVFNPADACWRGLGRIPQSGLKIKDKYASFDAEETIAIGQTQHTTSKLQKRCRCGDVLKGLISPEDCPLFDENACRPENPFGPCMVSREGTCNAYYKYKLRRENAR